VEDIDKFRDVIDTVKIDGCYLAEHRHGEDRRKSLGSLHRHRYERRFKHRRHLSQLDFEV